jgi:hypothetical protein
MSSIRRRLTVPEVTSLLDQTAVNNLILAGTVNGLVNSSTVNTKITVARINELVSSDTIKATINGLLNTPIAGDVGSFVLAQVRVDGVLSMSLGDTVLGSKLMLASAYGAFHDVRLSGTWECLGETNERDNGRNEGAATLFRRVS